MGCLQAYDIVVARAVAEMRVLAEFCLPFVRPGGSWIALKGPNPQAWPFCRSPMPAVPVCCVGVAWTV